MSFRDGLQYDYTDIIDALDDLDRAAKRLEMAAELFGPAPTKEYPTLLSDGSRHGMWLVMHDMVKTVQDVTTAIMKFHCPECNDNVEIC